MAKRTAKGAAEGNDVDKVEDNDVDKMEDNNLDKVEDNDVDKVEDNNVDKVEDKVEDNNVDKVEQVDSEVVDHNVEQVEKEIEHVKIDNKHNKHGVKHNVKQFFSKSKPNNKNLDKTTLFSEMADEFEEYFVDRKNKTIKNKDKFTNRIYGLSSYYGDIYFPNDGQKEGFPKKLPVIVEKVPMSQYQFAKYIIARTLEREETKHGYIQ